MSIQLNIDLFVDGGLRFLMIVLTAFAGHFLKFFFKRRNLKMKYLTTRQVDTCCWSEDTVRSFLTKLNRRMLLPSLSRPYISPVFSSVSMATDKIQPSSPFGKTPNHARSRSFSICLFSLVKCIIVAHDYVVIQQPVFTGLFLPANFNLLLVYYLPGFIL
jgi:hypothetical protein